MGVTTILSKQADADAVADERGNYVTERTSLLLLLADDDSNDNNNENDNNDDGERGESDCCSSSEGVSCSGTSYADIVMSNRPFRLYLCSYFITQAGEWLTYVASIELIEQLLGVDKRAGSRRYVSYLLVCRLLPNFLFIPFGGVLADAVDRRHSMIMLDAVGAIAPLFYLLASVSHFRSCSMEIIYAVTILQASIAALYEPCRTAIIPLMVPDDEPMKKATVLAELVWSVMAAIGSGMGGYLVSKIGVNACFVVDSITFMMSGFLMYLVKGDYDVSNTNDDDNDDHDDDDDNNNNNDDDDYEENKDHDDDDENKDHLSVWDSFEDMTVSGFGYIMKSSFRPLVLIKVSSALVYGGAHVLNVSFAEQDPAATTEQEQSLRLGALFFAAGAGCLIGPVLMDPLTNMENPMTVMNACVASFAIESLGCLIMGLFAPFRCTLAGSLIRAAGASTVWIDSQILLQTVVKPDMLGRVVAVDYGLALLAESCSAVVVGLVLQDDLGLSAMQVSTIQGIVALIFFFCWLVFRIKGSEAALKGY